MSAFRRERVRKERGRRERRPQKALLGLRRGQSGKTGFLAVGLVLVDHADLDGLVEGGAFLAEELFDGGLVIGSGGRAERLFERGEGVSVGFVFDACFFAVALRLHSGLADIRFGHSVTFRFRYVFRLNEFSDKVFGTINIARHPPVFQEEKRKKWRFFSISAVSRIFFRLFKANPLEVFLF